MPTDQRSPADRRRAPEHLVAMIAALADPPRQPGLSPWDAARAHHEQARRVADHIWAEAYIAGAGFAASLQPAPPMVVELARDAMAARRRPDTTSPRAG